MSKRSSKKGSTMPIMVAAYAAVLLVVVYTVFLITSYFQLERGLISEESVVQELRQAFSEDVPAEEFAVLEERLADVQRENRVLRFRNAIITVGASSVLGIILIVILVLFAKRTKELFNQQARMESTLLSIGDGLIVTDPFGYTVLVNKAFESMLGWSGEEVEDKDFSSVVAAKNEKGKDIRPADRLISKTLANGSRNTATMYYQRKDGTTFPAAVTAAPVMVGKNIAGAVVVFRDITKQKEIDEAKDTFISIASHQLRTPLTSIRWLIETLTSGRAGKLGADQKDILKEAHSSVLRLNALVAELLNVSRIETGRLRVNPESVDVVKLSADVVKELDPVSSEKGVKIKKDFPKSLPKIKLDPLIVRQVVLNLLSNAVKYSHSGDSVHFKIKKEGDYARLEVKDEGIGIPKEDQKKIFGKFYRATNTSEVKEVSGTGLGLFLAKKLVELSGGSIGFDSELNKGTTFWFTLPLKGSRMKEGEVTLSSSSPEPDKLN